MDEEYKELTRLVERLHRRFLDVLRVELNRRGVNDINAVQALLLANIENEEIVMRDLVERGYYQGSNVSYNIKKLTELGYLEQERSSHDRRSVRVRLTERAFAVVTGIRELETRHGAALAEQGMDSSDVEGVCRGLQQLERMWMDFISYRRS